jgi:hypothetical protein
MKGLSLCAAAMPIPRGAVAAGRGGPRILRACPARTHDLRDCPLQAAGRTGTAFAGLLGVKLMSLSLLTLIVAGLAPAPAIGQDQVVSESGARRRGWTLEAGLGVGYLDLPDASYGRGGLYGLNLGVGRFLTPDSAITLRGTGVSTLHSDGPMAMASALVSIQYFVTDRITVAGGMGVMFADVPVGAKRVGPHPGFAGNLRLGIGLAEWKTGSLRAVFEMNAGRVAGTRLINDGAGLEWQFY